MFVPTHPFIVSKVISFQGGDGLYKLFHSNGRYTYYPGLGRVRKEKKTNRRRLYYRCEMDKGVYWGKVTDKLIVERVMQYMEHYWGKKHTNCSALAHFLTTGEFVECDPEKRLLVIEQGMQVYSGQKVGVGDMLCIVYADQKFCASRKTLWRPAFKHAQKKRHDDGTFKHSLIPQKQSYTAQEIRNFCLGPSADDFHFLVCAGRYNDEPVWISQRGRYHPDDESTPLVFTVGHYEGYAEDVPLVMFLKKRR